MRLFSHIDSDTVDMHWTEAMFDNVGWRVTG